MKSLVFLALAITLSSSSALCQLNDTATDEDLNASELKAMLSASSASLQSYRFLLEMDQMTELVNLSDPAVESQRIASRSLGVGAVNMTARALKLVMATVILPEGDEGNATAMAIDEYLINDTVYLRLDGNWTSLRIPFSEDVWSQQNTIEQQVEMFNSSNITLLGSEVVEGLDCYKLKADIDMASFASQLSQNNSYLPLQPINFSQLFNNATLEAYYWITKDTHLLKKSEVIENFVISPQDLGLSPKGPENIEMRVYADISMIFDGFNESVNIELPAEAKTAEALSLNMTPPAQPVPLTQASENENTTSTV
ncbi:MAG TPA: hypothetical protein VLB04_13050 [Methanotrichaceae archaeon]|nr:hypothetical protein [Methanotrichaceae archaeon]